MSLVAYESSDDSGSEEPSRPGGGGGGGLFSLLPAPKTHGTLGNGRPSRDTKPTVPTRDSDDLDPHRGKLLSSLPRPKKRTEPVRITVPQVKRAGSDSDDDEPVKKKVQAKALGTGLSSLLPQPKNLSVKEQNRPLVPHTLTKRPEPRATKPAKPAPGPPGSSASPSAIKAAAKSAALHLARQIASDDAEHEDEDVTPGNYFSLSDSSKPLPPAPPSLEPEAPKPFLPLQPGPAADACPSDAPLDFGAAHQGAGGGAWGGPHYQQPAEGPEGPQGYYNEPYYQDPNTGLAEDEEPASSAMFDEEAFMRLQGKRNRGKEEVKFLEIKGDDQLSGNQQWITKNISEEKQERKSFSKKKGDQPTGQQRRKHQITYLIHQAKERELELKNNWADNKLTRRQTQAKYGF